MLNNPMQARRVSDWNIIWLLWVTQRAISSYFLYPISTSNGKVYVAQVKERAAARKIYDAAKKQGKTAGLVATKSVPGNFHKIKLWNVIS